MKHLIVLVIAIVAIYATWLAIDSDSRKKAILFGVRHGVKIFLFIVALIGIGVAVNHLPPLTFY